ncbi:Nuclear pore complex subunit [Coemansia spiralis]|uniref:Nuclear pore complex subunit n=2 Tax=Coemansia TaxID=4863 RepID=A0A9W8KXJ4_9FUNG|nr:Nuclear pore complex subunit [Coemansia umbellata]KAJ2619568.1 Nuclear pore complex subunit [Coemansia sp. RSA 1358]KAJ2678429.1 Nuclear pore complex subunit [Coemansia spiralis]
MAVYRGNARDQAIASADFAKLGQLILKQRFLRACIYQLAFAYTVAVVANVNLKNGLFSVIFALLSSKTLGYTVAAYIAGLGVLVVHSQLYQVTRAAHGSHFPKLQRLLRSPRSSGIAMGSYVLLSCYLFVIHKSIFGGRITQMWLYPEGYYGPPQLNPGWLASWVLAAVVGLSYGVQLVADERLQLAFPIIEQSRIYTLKDRMPGSFSRAFHFALGVLWRFWIGYLLFGWGMYRTVCGVLGKVMTTSSYSVGNPLFSASGIIFWLHCSTLIVLTWEFAHQLFEIVATEPTHINELSLDRNLCLLNGLKCIDNKLIQHLAYQELYRISAFDSEQRKSLLTDIDRKAGTIWSQVSGECVSVVSMATECLKAQNPAKQTKLAAAASSSSAVRPMSTTASTKTGGAPMSDILRQSRKGAVSGSAAGDKAGNKTGATDLFGNEAQGLEKYVLTKLRDMLLQSALGQRILSRSLRARSTSVFSNFQQQVWAIRSLMRLVECSINEDEYGIVQKDIAAVLDVLFAYLGELERSAAQTDGSGGIGAKDYNVQLSNRQTQAMIQVVRNALYTFTTSFYAYLEELKLPTAQGRQLQAFANFQA